MISPVFRIFAWRARTGPGAMALSALCVLSATTTPRAVSQVAAQAQAPPATQAGKAAEAGAQAADARPASPIDGDWLGTLNIPGGQALHLAIHLTKSPDGTLAATFDSLDQNAMGIKVERVTYKDGVLTLELPAISARYEGTVGREGAGHQDGPVAS